MDKVVSELVLALREERPVVLFLGQNYTSFDNSVDPVLKVFLSRIGNEERLNLGWRGVIESKQLDGDDYHWLSERFGRNALHPAIDEVMNVGWSAVFTTSIDPGLISRLETRGRVPEAILSKDHFSRVPRSRSRPPVHYLLGRADEIDKPYRAPRSTFELKQRISIHANQLLNRIPETVTPLGLLIVDGYDDSRDWLSIDEFLAPLSQSTGLKILWFGDTSNVSSIFFQELVKSGNIIKDSRSLAEVIVDINSSEPDTVLGSVFQAQLGTISLSENKFLQISPTLRLQVEASASVVDDTWTDSQLSYFGAEEIELFRRFHGDFGGARNLVEGIGQGYAIKRDFEDVLFSRVDAILDDLGNLDSLVVVHGQSGIGKSIGLARLVRKLRLEKKVPVLFAWGRIPTALDLDVFCSECEQAGAQATVVICDANQSFDRYHELTNGLKSRGRRIVVVGTSYKIEDEKVSGNNRFVEVPSKISEKELVDLRALLKRFSGQDSGDIDRVLAGENVLGLLYRHLSVTRARIIDGVSNEVRSVEKLIRLRAQNVPKNKHSRSVLAEKLIEVGLGDGNSAIFEDDDIGAASGTDTAGRLIDYIMAAGRLDCAVPVNLVIRALHALQDGLDVIQIAYLFGELDLFRWRMADGEGNDLLVQPRLQLEADIICRRRLADKKREFNCLLELINSVRTSGGSDNSELNFLLELLHKLHRDGPRGNAYKFGYLDVAEALTNLRTKHHVVDSSLMLQESAFRRSALLIAENSESTLDLEISEENRDEILNDAREIVELALNDIGDGKLQAGRKTRQNFLVERASIYGFLAVGLARRGAREEEVWASYLATRAAISKAMSSAGNYFSQDVGMWAPADILKIAELNPTHRAELEADIFAVIDHVNSDLLPTIAAEKFNTRRLKVAEVLRDFGMEKDAFSAIEQSNPALAYYLKARTICPEFFSDSNIPISNDARSKVVFAAEFLFSRFEQIASDIRPLQLLLQLKWFSYTGGRLLQKERCVLPSDRDFQTEILDIVSTLNQVAGEGSRNVFRFLEATLEWTVGSSARSRDLFRELAKDTEFEDPTRVTRRIVLEAGSQEHGSIRGRIERERSPGHWIVSLSGSEGKKVDLLARDFATEDLKPGREIRRFNIAFNYLGPIADPVSRFGAK